MAIFPGLSSFLPHRLLTFIIAFGFCLFVMDLSDISGNFDPRFVEVLIKESITKLRPAQEKAIQSGLLDGKSVLICTPTASGKTLIAEMAAMKSILSGKGKAVYIVPLKALANEKFKEFTRKWGGLSKVTLTIGDLDADEPYLEDKDLIICTAEKLDALMRHHAPWVRKLGCVIVDEIHLLNDPGRGPVLEILITMLREVAKDVQFVGLSATIGNPGELSDWLKAELVIDNWRPVPLHKGIYYDGTIEFEEG